MNIYSLNMSGPMLGCAMMLALSGCTSSKPALTSNGPQSSAVAGKATEVQRPLAKGANINAVDKDGRTLLFDAAKQWNKEATERLIAKGADVNVKDKYGVTPLFIAAAFGHKDVVELLIAKGANVEVKNNFGATPLHFAATFGHMDVADLLIAKGAKVTDKGYAFGKYGVTPLHQAAYRGHKDVAELLIAKGAKVNARDKKGRTPLAYALENKYAALAMLLRQHGGK